MGDKAMLPIVCRIIICSVTHDMRYDVEEGRLKLFFHEYFIRYVTEEEMEGWEAGDWCSKPEAEKSPTQVGNL